MSSQKGRSAHVPSVHSTVSQYVTKVAGFRRVHDVVILYHVDDWFLGKLDGFHLLSIDITTAQRTHQDEWKSLRIAVVIFLESLVAVACYLMGDVILLIGY